MSRLVAFATTGALALAAPASAVTWVFGGGSGTTNSVAVTVPGQTTLTVEGRRFTGLPTALASLTQLTIPLQISRTAPGLGVTGGGSSPQVDTNQANRREAFLVTADKAIRIDGLKLSFIDANDTLQIFGVNADNSLTALGFGGLIRDGLGGTVAFSNSGANSGTTVLDFDTPLPAFDRFVFTTREPGDVAFGGQSGQGYRLDSISGAAVPEPATWAMLITGFGLVGLAMRRRQSAAA